MRAHERCFALAVFGAYDAMAHWLWLRQSDRNSAVALPTITAAKRLKAPATEAPRTSPKRRSASLE
jgi:hypothetical protein